ncbi:alpha-2-antiplasmin isoform X2 [Ambystoma mexicanum]|uniref:alpha-2-antiplasmin isoform X2 n=1 Tax=Ambystoma mexicanum TaxID=8296 RepID=UPI0037E84C7E
MEKSFLVLLLLFVSGMHSPSGIPPALGEETGEPLLQGTLEENATEVAVISDGHAEKVIPLTKLQPSDQKTQQTREEAERADSLEEPVYESTFITTVVEDHADIAPEPAEALDPAAQPVALDSHTAPAPEESNGTDQGPHPAAPSSREEFDPEGEPSKSSELEGEDESCEKDASPEGLRRLAENMMAFSIDLFKQVDLESTNPNVVLSPLSISFELAQLALGAGTETEKKLLQALHVESVRCLHQTLKTVRKELGKRLLRVATRMYIRKGFELKEEFQKRSEAFYGAKPVTLGQSTEDNLNMINSWVNEVTEGQIPKFLSQLPEDLVLLLINAMRFKGIWMNKFDPSQTSEERFYLSEQSMVPVQMMRAPKYPLSFSHLEHVDAQVARLPFKGNMSFIVILPNSFELDTAKILDGFNQTELYSLFKRESPTLLRFPKLLLDFKTELNQALTRLGLGEIFFSPDLRGISEEALSVSSIQHQSTVELNEEGVVASAVTSIQISRSFTSFSINHPFMFMVMDDLTGMPLFLGCVRNPNPSAPVQKTGQNDSPDTKYTMNGYDPK